MNPTLELIEARTSTRTYTSEPISEADRAAILNAAFRAPTAGNMMLYSIIEVTDQALKDELAVTCDDQPFIATAPLVLVFLADYQKWIDLFDRSLELSAPGSGPCAAPGAGDLMLAASDALIAAQNAVVAAESLGIGSCYIGDILEQGEAHAQLFGLPPHVMPVAMLCFGHPSATRAQVPRYTANMVHENRYRNLTAEELSRTAEELQQMHAPHGIAPGAVDYPHVVHQRKYTSDFMAEMNRSVAWWLKRWGTRA